MYFLVLNVELLICAISVPVVLASHYEYYTYYTASTRENCYQDSYESCEGWWWGTTCHRNYYTRCNGVVYFQVAQQGRRCQSGWSGTDCNTPVCSGCITGTRCTAPYSCTDIDECSESTSGCNHHCYNNIGSYTCGCYQGYTLSYNGHTCNDIDECSSRTSSCSHYCNNNFGSYTCTCYQGYNLASNGRTCNDVNECSEGTSGCSQICNNNIGSYTCACNQGYSLASNRRTCDAVCSGCNTGTRCTAPDSCSDIYKCAEGTSGCAHTCTDTANSYICSCYPGYRLALDGRLCDDINECTEGKVACEHNCSNTAGSYSCRCNAGYRLRSDGHTCADINECTEGKVACEHNCSNTAGSYSCRCNAGYRLRSDGYTCADIDECVQSPCDMQHKFPCQNTNGGYQCVCESGFRNVGPHECHDIDECETLINNCTLQDNMTCENTIGSYKCVLRQGVSRNSTIITVIVFIVVGIFSIIVAAVCFIKRAKTRLRNKQAADPTPNNTDLAAEAVYYNVVKTTNSKSNESKMAKERQKTEAIYVGLDLSNLQRENFYEALEKRPKTYADVFNNSTHTST